MNLTRETKRWRWHPRWTRLGRDLTPMQSEASWQSYVEARSPSDERRMAELRKPLAGVVVTLVAAFMASLVVWRAAGVALHVLRSPAPDTTVSRTRAAGAEAPVAPTPVPGATRQPTATLPATVVVIIPIVEATPTAGAQRAPAGTAAPVAPVAAATPAATPVAQVVAPQPSPTSRPALPVSATETSSPARVHIVERGDTLFSIARRNGTTVGALVTANGLGTPDTPLSIGRRLVIPA